MRASSVTYLQDPLYSIGDRRRILGVVPVRQGRLDRAHFLRVLEKDGRIFHAGWGVLFTVAFTYPRAPRNDKNVSHDVGFLVVLLVIAGVGVDMLHSVIVRESQNEALKVGFALLEDGGELIIMSFIVWYAFSLLVRDGVAAEERVWRRIPRLWSSEDAASRQTSPRVA